MTSSMQFGLLGEAHLKLLKRDGLVSWTWPDLYEPFSVHFILPQETKTMLGKYQCPADKFC
jgi:hypothetical protein